MNIINLIYDYWILIFAMGLFLYFVLIDKFGTNK